MNTSYGVDAYSSSELNIAMRTSSGDLIKLDFANEKSSSLRLSQNKNGSSASMSFSSMQSFSFSIKSNGISEQDQKEIDAFMKIAQPFIDDFLKELKDDAPKSPVTKLASQIASLFDPSRERDDEGKNAVKRNIVKMFDKSLQELEPPKELTQEELIKKLFDETKNLLEKTLKEFDEFGKNFYA